VQETKIKLR